MDVQEKEDGRYRARLCAPGYSQVPGEDFSVTSSPVVDDITIRVTIIYMIVRNWDSEMLDVTTAFLHGKMEEEVHMSCPEGIEYIEKDWNGAEDCAELLQTIYGTKQAARQYWKKLMTTMNQKGFESTHAEGCLLRREDKHGTVMICVYVDDCLLIGDRTSIDKAISDIESVFDTRRLGPLQKYIGCTFLTLSDGSTKILQPDMIRKLEQMFGEIVSGLRNQNIPMSAGASVTRPKEGDVKLSVDDQRQYRSGVGMLLYMFKHSRPELNNAVRELSKVMDGATEEHMTLLRRLIKFVIQTRDRGIRVKPLTEDEVVAFVDSGFAGDKENRRSITSTCSMFQLPGNRDNKAEFS
jgi:hypothetical protein